MNPAYPRGPLVPAWESVDEKAVVQRDGPNLFCLCPGSYVTPR